MRPRSQFTRSAAHHVLISRKFRDTLLIGTVLVLVCISLYHANAIRALSSQRMLRTKVLSRSYIHTQAAERARKAAAIGKPRTFRALDELTLRTGGSSTHRITVAAVQEVPKHSQLQQATVNTVTSLPKTQQEAEVHNRDSQEAESARRDQATAVAVAAASSKAAVTEVAGSQAANATTSTNPPLMTSAFTNLIPEATPGQPYSATKGLSLKDGSAATVVPSDLPVAAGVNPVRMDSATTAAFGGSTDTTTSKLPDPSILPHLPADFNWKVYLMYHPDLAARGINSQAKAAEHWLQYGQYEGRIYTRLSVLMRYTACGGLTNQLYSHIAALTLAATLGAEVVLPPALTRSSFAHYFSMFKERNQVTWSAVPLNSLIDVEQYISYWHSRGIMLHRTPPLLSFPDMATPEVAYMQYDMPGINPKFITRLVDVYQRQLVLSQLVERARSAVVGHAETLRRLDPYQPVNYIVLDLPCTFFMLAKLSEMDLPQEAARSLHFPPSMIALGNKVMNGIANVAAGSDGMYNGIHLRLESDSRDWSEILGGRDAFWQNYVNAIQQAGFDASLPLYAATGLLSYGAEDEMTATLNKLTENGWASSVVYKELYLSKDEQDGLSSEQKALVDFIVLTKAHRVVGLGSSAFSYYLREYRGLFGDSKDDTILADASRIGTDGLFAECGRLTPG